MGGIFVDVVIDEELFDELRNMAVVYEELK